MINHHNTLQSITSSAIPRAYGQMALFVYQPVVLDWMRLPTQGE
jgi:hypothetical protein